MSITFIQRAFIIFNVICSLFFQNVCANEQDKEDCKTITSQQIIASENAIQTQTESQDNLLFGRELFQTKFSQLTFGNAQFPKHYRLGTGDKIGIFLSGKIQQNFEGAINVEGKIHIPTVGVFYIQGMTLEEFRVYLRRKLIQFYDNFNVDVMLIEPKPVQVSVVGEVAKPGKFLLTALNTVVDAIIAAGGPISKGSLRNIQLYRNGELKNTIDLYEFLMKPQYFDESFLESGDRIFVPFIESKVFTSGELKRNKVFELKPFADETLSDIIDLAGGFTEYAYLDKIEISRLELDGNRKVLYVDYRDVIADSLTTSNIILQNDDRIQVFSKLDQIYERDVFIHGEVKKPGKYVLEDGLRLADLILKAGNLTRSAYMLEAEIAKIDPKIPTTYVKVNLGQLLNDHDPEVNILLEEDDRVFIRQIPEWEVGPTIEIKGEVMFPGIYSINEASTSLSQILKKAGGFTDDALIREAKLIRKSSKMTTDKEYERLKQMSREGMTETEYQYLVMKENTQDIGQIVVDFYKLVIQNDITEDVLLENEDLIIIPKQPNVVYVTGRVAKPGGVIYTPGKKLKYYLEKAGGATWDADVKKTKITKVSGEILDDEDLKSFKPGDIVWIPRKPDRDWWEIFRQTTAVAAQIATVYLIIERATN